MARQFFTGVKITAGDENTLYLDTGTTGQQTTIFYQVNGSYKYQQRVGTNWELYNYTTSSWDFHIQGSTGRLGLKTNSPLGSLHINNTSVTSDTDGTATMTASGQDSIILYSAGTEDNTYGSITWMTGSRRRAMITAVAENSDSDFQGIAFYTRGTDGAGDMYETMRLKHNGTLQIGTLTSGRTGALIVNQEGGVTPVAKFMSRTNKAIVQVSDNDTTGYISSENGLFSIGRNGGVNATNININASHQVLIGASTASFSDKLYLSGDAYINGALRIGTAATYVGKMYNSSGVLTIETDGTRDIQLGNSSSTSVFIDTSEKQVGIGVTDPDARLEIKGAGGGTGLTFKTTDSSSNETFYIMDGGRVGVRYYPLTIGVASTATDPTTSGDRLFVSGTARNVVVNSAGSVGIGEATPDELLHLKNSESTIKFESTHGRHSLINQGGGNFHIKAVHGSGVAINYGDTNNPGLLKLYNNTSAKITLNASAGDGDFDGTVDATNYKINGSQGSDGQVLTSTGSGVAWEDASGGVSGSGADNRLAIWNGTTAIDSDADFYVSASTLHTNALQVTSDNNFYRETINSNSGGESWNSSNGWHRIIEITGGQGRGKCHFLIQGGGGSGTPFRFEAIVNTAWSNNNATLTILHNSYPNFLTHIRVVRNSTSGKSFVDIKGTGEDYLDVTILPDGSTSAAIVNFTNVNTLPSGDSKQIERSISNYIFFTATGTGSNTVGENPFAIKYDGSIFGESATFDNVVNVNHVLNVNTPGSTNLISATWTSSDTGVLYIKEGGATKILLNSGDNSYINTGHNFGVGTTSPEFALHLAHNAGSGGLNSGVMLEMRSSTITDPAGMRFVSQTGGTTNYMQNLYDGANLKWKHWSGSAYVDKVTFSNAGTITTAGDIIIPATKALYLDGGGGTYIYQSSDGVIDFYGDTVQLFTVKQNGTQNEVVVNEGSGDVDFRVEANNSQHALFVEAEGAGAVGIGTDDPEYKLDVNAGATNVVAKFKSTDNQAWISVQDDASGTYGALYGTDSDAAQEFVIANSSATKRIWSDTSGRIGIGPGTTGSPYDSTTFLHVKGTTRSIVQQSSTTDAYYMFGDAAADNVAWIGYNHSSNNLNLQSGSTITLYKDTDIQGSLRVEDGNNYILMSEGSNSIAELELHDSTSVFLQGWGSDFRIAVNGTYNNHAMKITNARHAYLYNDVYLESGTGGTTSKLIFKTTNNTDDSKFIRTNAYWNEYGAHRNEGHKFIDSNSNVLLQLNGDNSGTGNGALSVTTAGNLHTHNVFIPSNKGVHLADRHAKVSFELPYFTNGTSNLAVDLILGNAYLNGIFELKLTSGYSHQNATGEAYFKWIVGFNTDGTIWYTPKLVESHVTNQQASQIYVADPAWDSTNSRYYIRIYHKVSSGNQWEGTLENTSQNRADDFVSNFSVGSLLTSTSTTNTHPVGKYFSDNTGDVNLTLKSQGGGDPTLIMDSSASNRSGLINFKDNGTQMGQIIYKHNGDTMEFYTGGTGSGHKELSLNETAGAIIRNQATIGHTSNRSGATLHVEGNNNGNWNDGIVLEEPSGWNAVVWKRNNNPKMFAGLYSGSDNYIMMSANYSNSGTAISAPRTDAIMQILPGNDTVEHYLPNGFGKNVGIGTTPHSTFRLDVLSTATDWTARIKNYTTDGYGLAVDCGGASSSTTYAFAVYGAAGTGDFFIRNDGLASLGITPYASAANAKLQLPSHALAIKNNVSGSNNNWSYIRNTATSSSSNIEFTTGTGIALTLNHNKSAVFTGDVTVNTGLYPDANYGAELGTSNLRWSVIRGKYLDLQQSSASDPVLRLTDEGVASYDVIFPDTSTYQLQTNTSSNKTFKLHNAGSGTFSMDIEGDLTVNGSFQHPINLVVNSLTAHNIRTKGTSANEEFPIGHWNEGEEVFSIDPTWSETQLQNYFGSSNVTWLEDSTAPSGYAIKIDGSVNVGVDYGSGFPHIAIEKDAIYYMEVYIRGFHADSVVGHYMGSIDVEHDFTSPPTGSGNPGSYGYWVMGNTSSNGTTWNKRSGIIRGFSDSTTGAFETAAKYWTPQALFNYSYSGSQRACVISGWRVVKISAQRMLADGSTGNPSLTFAEDQNTGIYRPAADQIGFVAGGSRKMYLSGTTAYLQNLSGGLIIDSDGAGLKIKSNVSEYHQIFHSTSTNDLVISSAGDDVDFISWIRLRQSNGGSIMGEFNNSTGHLGVGGQSDTNYELKVHGYLDTTNVQTGTNICNTGDPGFFIKTGNRLGMDESGTRSWTIKAASGNLNLYSGDGNGLFNVSMGLAAPVTINGATNNGNSARLDVKLAQTNGTLGAANTVHFGDQAHSSGQIMGMTLGYKEHANTSYRKLAMVAEGLGDNAARQNLHLLVNNVYDSSSASLSHRVLSIDGITQETSLKSVIALRDSGNTTGYRKVHLGLFAGPPSATTESRSWRLGRLYYNAHWGHYGTMKIRVSTKYPYNGYLEYDIIQGSNSGNNYAILRNLGGDSSFTGQAQVYLNQQTDTGVDYGGHDIYYKDIVLQLDTYIQARVTVDVNHEYFEFDKTSVTSSQYYYSTLFRDSTNQAQATLSDQASLTHNIYLPGHLNSTGGNSSHNLRATSHLRLNTGKGLYFDGNTHSHTYIKEEGDNNMKFYVGGTERANFSGGTNTLAQATVVNGTLTVNPDGDSQVIIGNGGTNASTVFAGTGDELYLGSNNSSAIRIHGGGITELYGALYLPQYIQHAGDTSTNINFESSQITIATSGGSHIQINNDENIYFRTNGTNRFKMDTSGNFIATADVIAYGSVSDISYKENIKPITGALDLVDKLQGVTFDWKKDTETRDIVGVKEDIGFIAQDVEKVLPTLVRENENGKLSIRDKGIVPVLVEAIKELKAEIEELKKQIK